MIRVVVYIIAIACVVGAVSAADVDMDAILGDEDVLQEMLKCFMADSDEACDDQAKEMRERLPSIVSTNCGDCSEAKAANVLKFFKYMATNHKDQLDSLMMKYDSNGEAMKKFGETWRSQGVAI